MKPEDPGAALMMRGLEFPVQPTDYDTSWAVRLTGDDGAPAYPQLVDWLLERQREDGSWGSRVDYAPDRFLSTLAVAVALARTDDPRCGGVLPAAESYLGRSAGRLEGDFHRPVGFELILPALLDEARLAGLDLPYASLKRYERERDQKLSLLPIDRLFETRTTALFSLEAFREGFDAEKVAGLLLDDGSMAGSPSATAYLLGRFPGWRERLPRSAAYLEGLLDRPGSGLPAFHPCDVFARAWTLYYLQQGGPADERADLLRPHYEHLRKSLTPEGVGFASTSGFVDSDDTATVLLVLHRAGYEVDGSCLLEFERDRCFAVYSYERDPSISANLHILEALDTMPEEHRPRVRDKIVGYALAARRKGAYWSDKWHASVYYPTTRALMVLSAYAPEEMEHTLEWLLATQRADGSWGQYGATVEETSIALLALLRYRDVMPEVPTGPLHRAAEYLSANEEPPSRGYPELWVCKTLYAPVFAIESGRLAALALYHDTFGHAR